MDAMIQEIFKKTRSLVAKGWTQGAYARDANGRWSVSIDDPEAVYFCITGALSRACVESVNDGHLVRFERMDLAEKLYKLAMAEFCNKNAMPSPDFVVAWNDSRFTTQADVLVALDRCISA